MVEGAAVFSLAIGFEATPTEPKWVFDTRDPITLVNGVALKVNVDGTLTLLVQDAATTGTITTPTPTSWVSGKITEVVAEWSSSLLRISVDGVTLIEDLAATVPDMTGITATSVQLGADSNVSGSLDSEFVRATFLKRPRR
ncbi:hypothetical protein LCGC14_0499380 [marine sediment metagenome]|uniref:Uncharacterized protein n=1 Tax=marine sediment metagenome TaxID=412755 RepID=A0A0F9VD20_9ZZZZ